MMFQGQEMDLRMEEQSYQKLKNNQDYETYSDTGRTQMVQNTVQEIIDGHQSCFEQYDLDIDCEAQPEDEEMPMDNNTNAGGYSLFRNFDQQETIVVNQKGRNEFEKSLELDKILDTGKDQDSSFTDQDFKNHDLPQNQLIDNQHEQLLQSYHYDLVFQGSTQINPKDQSQFQLQKQELAFGYQQSSQKNSEENKIEESLKIEEKRLEMNLTSDNHDQQQPNKNVKRQERKTDKEKNKAIGQKRPANTKNPRVNKSLAQNQQLANSDQMSPLNYNSQTEGAQVQRGPTGKQKPPPDLKRQRLTRPAYQFMVEFFEKEKNWDDEIISSQLQSQIKDRFQFEMNKRQIELRWYKLLAEAGIPRSHFK